MTTATDIITYIGVPLAVLGVLPILYTFTLSILTQRRIRHLLLSHGHRPHRGTTTRNTHEEGFMLRASPMTSLIEVEMPRYTIAPVDRRDERYWEVDQQGTGVGHHGLLGAAHFHSGEGHMVERVESTLSMLEEGRVRGFLRGGSWRTFHWRRLVVGRKLYRIQYEDELREPPAEIEFAELIDFLMDWGAELDAVGWEKLRIGGLWTPAATVLLRVGAGDEVEDDVEGKGSACGSGNSRTGEQGDWVLRTSMPDDSDGILTLCVRWPAGHAFGAARNVTSLPPGWGRLRKPAVNDNTESPANKDSLSSTIFRLTKSSTHLQALPSLRFKLESNHIHTLHPEPPTPSPSRPRTLAPRVAAARVTTGLSSLLTLTKTTGSLFGHTPPTTLLSFLDKETLPTGILVLLTLLDPALSPPWDTTIPPSPATAASAHHARFIARQAAERLEATMPPDQARVHRLNRETAERKAQLDASVKMLADARAREERRLMDAIVSPRVGVEFIVGPAREWLVARGFVDAEWTVEEIVERVLYLIVLQARSGLGVPVLAVLEEWMAWSVAGGMKREQFEMLDGLRPEFCYAVCLLDVVRRAVAVEKGVGKASVDMLECLRLWKKVRLG